MGYNVSGDNIISSACDWRDKIIIGEPLAPAADAQLESPLTDISWPGLRTLWNGRFLFSSVQPPPFFGQYSEQLDNVSGIHFPLPGG